MAKILLIDDDSLLVRMYHKKLENDGHEVATANDGEDGLKKAGEFGPDLILLDVMMPKMDGYQVLEKLKASDDTKSIPVIMLTNVGSSDDDVKKGLDLGAKEYLIKASNRPSEVVKKVKEVLG